MKLDEAREHIGDPVIYQSPAMREGLDQRPPEKGIITSIGRDVVFVAYGRAMNSTATYSDDLDLIVEHTSERDMLDEFPRITAAQEKSA